MKSKAADKTLLDVHIALLASSTKLESTVTDCLTHAGASVSTATLLDDLIDECLDTPAQLLCIDTKLCEEFEQYRKDNPESVECLGNEIIVFSNRGGTEEAMEWARMFQGYFIAMPIHADELVILIERVLDTGLLKKRLARYESEGLQTERFGSIVVQSPEMKDTLRLARILAGRDDSLLFVGAVGTGKEKLARTIHEHGTRSGQPFFSINCRSLSGDELATEIFGHSDSGDDSHLLALAEGGSLFLEEFSVISEELQSKLLRLLDQGVYTAMDARSPIACNVRIFAGTSQPLDEMVARGAFSEELFFRINRFSLHLPTLRRRSEDIPLLIKQVLARISRDRGIGMLKLTEETLEMLMGYSWPGNLRELENVLDFASLVAGEGPIEPQHLPRQFQDDMGSLFVGSQVDDLPPMSEIERRYIVKVMEATNGNKVKAANILDINRATLHRKLQIYEANKRMEVG